MIDLTPLEIWLVTGSQHLYGAEALRKVYAQAGEVAGALNAGGRDSGQDCAQAAGDGSNGGDDDLPRGKRGGALHRGDHVVPYFLAVEDVDQWAEAVAAAVAAFAHAAQSGFAVGDN